MLKLSRFIISSKEANRGSEGVYDRLLDETRRTMFRMIFAIAIASKVKPKDIAKFFSNEHTDKYAREVNEALMEKSEKEKNKEEKKTIKSKKTNKN